jgi:hypothetical protein
LAPHPPTTGRADRRSGDAAIATAPHRPFNPCDARRPSSAECVPVVFDELMSSASGVTSTRGQAYPGPRCDRYAAAVNANQRDRLHAREKRLNHGLNLKPIKLRPLRARNI